MLKKRLIVLFCVAVIGGQALAIGEITPTPNSPVVPTLAPTVAPLPTNTPAPFASTPVPIPPQADEIALLDAAIALIQTGQYDQAITELTSLIAINPNNPEAFAFRGVAHQLNLAYQLSIDDFTRALDLVPYSWEFYTFRGSSYQFIGETGEAMLDYDKALDLNPRYVTAYNYRSNLFLALGDRANSDIDSIISEGIEIQGRGDFTRAILRLSEAINSNPSDNRTLAYALYNRALTTYLANDVQTAILDYSLSLENYPTMHDSFLGRGIAYRENDQLELAGRDFYRRIEILESNTINAPITPNTAVDLAMDYGVVARYTFEGTGGDVWSFIARDIEGVGVDPLIALLAPDGQVLAGDDDFGGELDSSIAGFTLPQTGTYTLVVSHANGGYTGRVSVLISR